MKIRNLTCIICPKGCPLVVSLGEDGKILGVDGNTCPRGARYAEEECTHPMRTVTSTMRTADGHVVPCKSEAPVPKESVFAVMANINKTIAPAVVSVGDILLEDVAGTGVSVVATANKES